MFDRKKYKEILDIIKKNKKNTEIIAISKNHPKEYVLEALNSGVRIFGENRVQEALTKFKGIKSFYPKIELHLTGSLQTNKTKDALKIFDVFHTLDREKLALEFIKFPNVVKNKKFFIQINTGSEHNKGGIETHKADDFINYCISDLNLPIVGLMCIPPINDKPTKHFKLLREIANINNLKQLSIGMSNDYMEAVIMNATYIRLGTILFGKRK